jgi:hypothetical protein
MNLIYFLLILAILIPALALLGHLYVAYKFAPERAKRSILDALTGDQDFQNDLMKSLLNNLFKEVRDGDKSVIPIDAMIQRAKSSFRELMGDQDFQNDLMKFILNNLFKEVRDGDKSVIPIDAMIQRAKSSFQEWVKAELPKVDPSLEATMMQPAQDEYGNVVQPDIMTNIILSQVPKKYRGYVALAMKYFK